MEIWKSFSPISRVPVLIFPKVGEVLSLDHQAAVTSTRHGSAM